MLEPLRHRSTLDDLILSPPVRVCRRFISEGQSDFPNKVLYDFTVSSIAYGSGRGSSIECRRERDRHLEYWILVKEVIDLVVP